jgi:hypothetical protein
MRKALADPGLLGNVLAGESWAAWRTLMIAAMGEELTDDEREIFTRLTGREREPLQRVEEMASVVGRRGGKSRAKATLAAYIGGLCSHDLAPGERGVLLCIAPDQRQASITLDYATAAFEASPILSQLIANRTADTLELTNGTTIEVRSASFRRLRGPTYIAVIADEAAFWFSDEYSANADTEILNAVRPGLATTGGSLIIASSPYARRGVLWEMHRRHYGSAGDPLILVAQGTSREFNPTLPQSVVDRAMERDAAAASAEYLGQFRTDIESYIAREVIDAATVPGRYELPPIRGVSYAAFTDPSGGSSDSFTLAIAHRDTDGRRATLDVLRERRPPFSPDGVVQEFAELLKAYDVRMVTGDRYAGEWPRERFRVYGIEYALAEKPKSDLYRDLLPLLNSGRVELLELPRLATQLTGLERRTARGGKDSIGHAPGSHDDVANCVAGSLLLALAAAPTLWRPEAFLIDGTPSPMPTRCNLVFGVLMAGQGGDAAIVYFARTRTGGSPLLILDCEVAPLVPALFNGIVARLIELAKVTRAEVGAVLFASGVLADEVRRLGYNAEVIDDLAAGGDGLLALAAAVHIGAGRVKITGEALAKAEYHPLGGILDATAHDDDPLRTAALVGIAIALDTGRSLTVRAA